MDMQDSQDNRRSDLQFVEITEKIIGCAFEVINELGTEGNWNRGRPIDQFWQSET